MDYLAEFFDYLLHLRYMPMFERWMHKYTDELLVIGAIMAISIVVSIYLSGMIRQQITKIYKSLKIPHRYWRVNRINISMVILWNWAIFVFTLMISEIYNDKWDKSVGFISLSMIFLILKWLLPILNAWLILHDKWINNSLQPFVPKILSWVLFIIAISSYLDLFGVKVMPFVAGLGFLGLSLSLAAQEMVRNWLSGILIISEKPFGVGDVIKVDDVAHGRVENIGFRTTRITRVDSQWAVVPNSLLLSKPMINESRMMRREIAYIFMVDVNTPIKKMQKLRAKIHEIIAQNADIHPENQKIYLGNISKGIELKIQVFSRSPDWQAWNDVNFKLGLDLIAIFHELKINFSPLD